MANGTKRVFKTKKKLSGGRSIFRKWNEWEEGDYIIGKYVGMKEDNYDKPNWMVQVEEAVFADEEEAAKLVGKQIGLNSNGQLDKAMEKVEEGQFVQVTYNGKSEIEKGKYAGKEAHLVGVDLVEEDDGSTEEEEETEEEEDDGADL